MLFLKFASPVPVSITTSREPVLTAHGQYGIAIMSGAGLQIGGRQRGIDLLAALVGDKAVRKVEAVDAVGDDRHLDAADLVAVPARGLLAGERRGGLRRRRQCGRQRGGAGGGGTAQHGAAS